MKTQKFILLFLLVLIFGSCKKAGKSTNPEITLNGSESIEISRGENTPDPGATATDKEDGDLTSQIVSDWSNVVNKDASGEYTVTYSVSDKKGNKASKTRKVTVKMGGAAYYGTYATNFQVVGGGASNTTCYIVAGDNANQFTVNYYLGPGGIPFKVNISGVLGTDLNIVPTSGSIVLTGSGHSENNGSKIILNMKQNSLDVVCTMIKQ